MISAIISATISAMSHRFFHAQGFNDLELVAQIPNTRFAWVPHVGWQYWCYLLVGVMQGLLSVLIVKCLALGSSFITRASLFKARQPA